MPRKRPSLATGGSDFKDYLSKLSRAQADNLEKLVAEVTGSPDVTIDTGKGTLAIVSHDPKYNVNIRRQLTGKELKDALEGAREAHAKKTGAPPPLKKEKPKPAKLKDVAVKVGDAPEQGKLTGFAAVRAARLKKIEERKKALADGGKTTRKARVAKIERTFTGLEPKANQGGVLQVSKEAAAAALKKNKGKSRPFGGFVGAGVRPGSGSLGKGNVRENPVKGVKAKEARATSILPPRRAPQPRYTPGPVKDSTSSLNPGAYGTNAPPSGKPVRKFKTKEKLAGFEGPVIGQKAAKISPSRILAAGPALRGGGGVGGGVQGLEELLGVFRKKNLGKEDATTRAIRELAATRQRIEQEAAAAARAAAEAARLKEQRAARRVAGKLSPTQTATPVAGAKGPGSAPDTNMAPPPSRPKNVKRELGTWSWRLQGAPNDGRYHVPGSQLSSAPVGPRVPIDEGEKTLMALSGNPVPSAPPPPPRGSFRSKVMTATRLFDEGLTPSEVAKLMKIPVSDARLLQRSIAQELAGGYRVPGAMTGGLIAEPVNEMDRIAAEFTKRGGRGPMAGIKAAAPVRTHVVPNRMVGNHAVQLSGGVEDLLDRMMGDPSQYDPYEYMSEREDLREQLTSQAQKGKLKPRAATLRVAPTAAPRAGDPATGGTPRTVPGRPPGGVKIKGVPVNAAPTAEEVLASLGIPAADADEPYELMEGKPPPRPSAYHVSPGASAGHAATQAAKTAASVPAGGAGAGSHVAGDAAKAAAAAGATVAADAGEKVAAAAGKGIGKAAWGAVKIGGGLLKRFSPHIFAALAAYDLARLGYDLYKGNDEEEEMTRRGDALDLMHRTAFAASEREGRIDPDAFDRLLQQVKMANMTQGMGTRGIQSELEQLVSNKRDRLAQLSTLSQPSLAEAYASMGVL